ncbi:Hypothetical predicted protein [Podarcis lilfordi]|nr:Hypothetical predicted protein [Podarcis lilfordi]
MSYYGMGKPSAGFFPPPSPGELGSREVEMAPSGPSSLYPGMPRETPASGGLSSAIGLLRRKLQAKQGLRISSAAPSCSRIRTPSRLVEEPAGHRAHLGKGLQKGGSHTEASAAGSCALRDRTENMPLSRRATGGSSSPLCRRPFLSASPPRTLPAPAETLRWPGGDSCPAGSS